VVNPPVLYRQLPDLDPPSDAGAGVDAPDLARTDAMVAMNEQYQRMLARIAEVGMEMIESIVARARADAEAEKAGVDAFCKVSQAIRRTIALQVKLARDAGTDRNAVDAERARRRADAAAAHKATKDEAIRDALHEAYLGSDTGADFDPDGDIVFGMMDIDTERLDDDDEFAGYLDRPVGETVAKLCAIVGLDPGACALEDGAWRVRRPPRFMPPVLSPHAVSGAKVSPPCESEFTPLE
jgi:hypothetical protein